MMSWGTCFSYFGSGIVVTREAAKIKPNNYFYALFITKKLNSMRFITHSFLCTCFLIFFFSSCTKEVASTAVEASAVDKVSPGTLTSLASDTTTLTLQPGKAKGQDAYVNAVNNRPNYANANYNYLPELGASAWTIQTSPLQQRVYINFTDLSALPKNAKIVSATLYLYGLDPNTSASAPQGNSQYPGSPYSAYTNNGCYVSLVSGGAWTEDSITWNNKPDYRSSSNDGVIPASDKQWNYDVAVNVKPLVQTMVDKRKNNGFCIHLQNEEIYRCITFASSEAADANKRPKLVVKYVRVG